MIGIIGAGMGGLFCARALARAGLEVTLLETDAPYEGEVDLAFADWKRPGVAQLRQPHAARSLIPKLLKRHDPELYAAIVAAGMVEWPFHLLSVQDPDVPHDPELFALLGRRPALEVPLRRMVERTPGVTILRRTVKDLLFDRVAGRRPRVTGVVTGEGPMAFDQVVASMGRRNRLAEWLAPAGVQLPPDRSWECGITYYSRYYRFRTGADIPRGPYPSGPSGSLPSVHYTMNRTDHDTFSFMLGVAPWREEFKALRHDAVFAEFVATLPGVSSWLHPDKCAPIRSVEPFAGLVNRYRSFHDAEGPLVDDLYVVGDTRFHTNPIYGWGMAFALHQSYLLRDAFAGEADPRARHARFEREVDDFARTYFEASSREDAARSELWRGDRQRGEPGTDRYFLTAVLPAVYRDQYIFRAVTRRMHLLDHPEAIHRDPEVLKRAERVNARLDDSITEAELLARVRAIAEKQAAVQ